MNNMILDYIILGFMILIIILIIFIICCLHISSKVSEKEEQTYIEKHMNLMDLDDDNKDWNLDDELTYDDYFMKKEDGNERNTKRSIK